jgi:hypothetical protein
MPLYSCEQCGWATTASWRQAIPAHASGSPDCYGTVQLVRHQSAAASTHLPLHKPEPVTHLRPSPVFGGGGNAA